MFSDDNSNDWYYDPQNEFQERVLKHAAEADQHPLEYLAHQLDEAFAAMDEFAEQDPKLSKADYVGIKWDIEEAKHGITNACELIPAEVAGLGGEEP